jgi:hypothetical protein
LAGANVATVRETFSKNDVGFLARKSRERLLERGEPIVGRATEMISQAATEPI